jgi:hypothetical protein
MAVKRAKTMLSPFRIAKLELKPGDMVVLQTDLFLDRDQIQQLKNNMDEQLRSLKAKSIILVGGLKIGIMRKTGKRTRLS